jgi:hypothetical protein
MAAKEHRWLKRVVYFLIALVSVLIGVLLAGRSLPEEHVVARTLTTRQPPEEVWRTITNFEGQIAWRKSLKGIERLPDVNGVAVWREDYGNDVLKIQTFIAPEKMRMMRVVLDNRIYTGNWEYVIIPVKEGGCLLKITETAQIRNPLFRFVDHYLIGESREIEKYETELAAQLGEKPARIQ